MVTELKSNKALSSASDFIDSMVSNFRQLTQDSYERKNEAASASSKKLKEILTKGIWYSYDYYVALQRGSFKDRLNWVVDTGASFHGFLPKGIFKHVRNESMPMGYGVDHFVLQDNVSPSKALERINESLCLLDCGSTQDIAFYRALQKTVGQERFDHLFASDSPFPLEIGNRSNNRVFKTLCDRVIILDSKEIRVGDFCYFSNVNDYFVKHPAGDGRGLNVICCDVTPERRYLGFGLNPQGVDREGVEKFLWQAFNADPAEEDFLTPTIWKHHFSKSLLCDEEKSRLRVNSLKNRKISWEAFKKTESRLNRKKEPVDKKLHLLIYRPNIERINLLATASLDQIRKLFQVFSKNLKA